MNARTTVPAKDLPTFALIRGMAAVSYILLVFIGDLYHNSDAHHAREKEEGTTTLSPLHYELKWLRCDFFTISLIQASTFQVWVANYGFIEGHWWAAALSWSICVFVVIVSVFYLDPNRDPATVYENTKSPAALDAIKGLLGTQFVTYVYLISTGPAGCAWSAAVYYIFVPGFVAYAARFPEDRSVWNL